MLKINFYLHKICFFVSFISKNLHLYFSKIFSQIKTFKIEIEIQKTIYLFKYIYKNNNNLTIIAFLNITSFDI